MGNFVETALSVLERCEKETFVDDSTMEDQVVIFFEHVWTSQMDNAYGHVEREFYITSSKSGTVNLTMSVNVNDRGFGRSITLAKFSIRRLAKKAIAEAMKVIVDSI